jgi:hypothetical protein
MITFRKTVGYILQSALKTKNGWKNCLLRRHFSSNEAVEQVSAKPQ